MDKPVFADFYSKKRFGKACRQLQYAPQAYPLYPHLPVRSAIYPHKIQTKHTAGCGERTTEDKRPWGRCPQDPWKIVRRCLTLRKGFHPLTLLCRSIRSCGGNRRGRTYRFKVSLPHNCKTLGTLSPSPLQGEFLPLTPSGRSIRSCGRNQIEKAYRLWYSFSIYTANACICVCQTGCRGLVPCRGVGQSPTVFGVPRSYDSLISFSNCMMVFCSMGSTSSCFSIFEMAWMTVV